MLLSLAHNSNVIPIQQTRCVSRIFAAEISNGRDYKRIRIRHNNAYRINTRPAQGQITIMQHIKQCYSYELFRGS